MVKSPQINIGKYEITSKTSERRVILDSGLTYAMMPKKDMIELIKILKTDFNINCESKSAAQAEGTQSLADAYTAEQLALPTCTCDDSKIKDLPTIQLTLAGELSYMDNKNNLMEDDAIKSSSKKKDEDELITNFA
jgi:hypothetical protein